MTGKAKILITLSLFLLTACDPPHGRRAVQEEYASKLEIYEPAEVQKKSLDRSQEDLENDYYDTQDNDSTEQTVIPQYIQHCSWAKDGINGFMYRHDHFGREHSGSFSACQHRDNELEIFFQAFRSDFRDEICIWPLHIVNNANGQSESKYLGNPRCDYINNPKKVYQFSLRKDTNLHLSSLPVNAIMIMRDAFHKFRNPIQDPRDPRFSLFNEALKIPDAYTTCMNQINNFGDSSFCESFGESGEFIIVRLERRNN